MLQVLENFPRVLIKKIFLSESLGLLSNTKFLAALSSLADCWEQSNFSFGKKYNWSYFALWAGEYRQYSRQT